MGGGGTNEVVGDVGQVEIVLFVIESDAIFGDRDPDLLFEIHRLLLLPGKPLVQEKSADACQQISIAKLENEQGIIEVVLVLSN